MTWCTRGARARGVLRGCKSLPKVAHFGPVREPHFHLPRLIKKVLELGGAPIFSGHVTLRALVWPVVKLVGSPLQQLRASSHEALGELELNNGFKGNQRG